MKDSYISYYELLTRIKEGNIPQLLILHLVPTKSVEYVPDYDYVSDKLVGYEILNNKDEDENYSYHLGDCFLEGTMFDNVIEIIEEEKEIEKIIIKDMKIQAQSTGNYCYSISQPMKIIINKLNEVIDTTKKLEKNLKEQTK